MTIRVMILGEGPTDVGTEDGDGNWLEGCIPQLIKKVNPQVSLEFVPIKKNSFSIVTLPKNGKKKFQGHGKNIQKLIIYSQLRKIQYDLIAYYGDTDKESGTKNTPLQAQRASSEAYQQAHDAFDFFQKDGFAVIPLRMLESWLLADEQSFHITFGERISLPTHPELLWGDKHDPNSDYPKHALQRILRDLNSSSDRQTFCNLVQNIEIITLLQKCPISFPPFYNKALELLAI